MPTLQLHAACTQLVNTLSFLLQPVALRNLCATTQLRPHSCNGGVIVTKGHCIRLLGRFVETPRTIIAIQLVL